MDGAPGQGGMEIRSAIPGRERWAIAALRGEPRLAAAVESVLSRERGILGVWANARTGRLLVRYETGLSEVEIRRRIAASLGSPPLTLAEHHVWRRRWVRGYDSAPEATALRTARSRLLFSGGLLAATALKRLVWGAGPLASHPVLATASALLSVTLGYSLRRHQEDRPPAPAGGRERGVLGSASLVLLTLTESLEGLAALGLTDLGDALRLRELRASRLAIRGGAPAAVAPLRPHSARQASPVPSSLPLPLAAASLALLGGPDRALAVLIAASPVAASSALPLAKALTLLTAARQGVLFNDDAGLGHAGRTPLTVVLWGTGVLTSRRSRIRFGISSLLATLQAEEGVRVLLLASGPPEVVGAVARSAGIAHWQAGLRPAERLRQIYDLQAQGERIVLVGARAAESPGPAAADMVATGDLESAVAAVSLHRRTERILGQNAAVERVAQTAGAVAAAFGVLSHLGAASLQNRLKILLELNSLRLAIPPRTDR